MTADPVNIGGDEYLSGKTIKITKSVADYYADLCRLNAEITEKFSELNRMQSYYDKQISRIYHDIENDVFNVVEGYRYAKQLQDILKARRHVKTEIRRIYPLLDFFAGDSVDRMKERFSLTLQKEKTERIKKLKIKVEVDAM